MATDDERRAAARSLRDMAERCDWIHTGFIQNVLRLEPHPLLIDGSLYTSASVARLADLIEPSCDRDALLALAGEKEKRGGEESFVFWGELRKYAHRIREVLGVEP